MLNFEVSKTKPNKHSVFCVLQRKMKIGYAMFLC
jgi:hypothetical protein